MVRLSVRGSIPKSESPVPLLLEEVLLLESIELSLNELSPLSLGDWYSFESDRSSLQKYPGRAADPLSSPGKSDPPHFALTRCPFST